MTNEPVVVRQATVRDLEILTPLFDAYRQFYRMASDPARAASFLLERFEHNQSVVFLAFEGSTATGFTLLYPSFSSTAMARVFVLNDLFVASESRRSGTGTALLEAAADYARRVRAVRLVLSTELTNTAAQAVYEKAGWNGILHSASTSSSSSSSGERRSAFSIPSRGSAAAEGCRSALAGDVDERTRYVGGLNREQPEDGTRHLFGLSAPLHGHCILDAVDPSGLAAFGVKFGMDEAWPDPVDPDTLFRYFPCESYRECLYRALLYCVVNVLSGRCERNHGTCV